MALRRMPTRANPADVPPTGGQDNTRNQERDQQPQGDEDLREQLAALRVEMRAEMETLGNQSSPQTQTSTPPATQPTPAFQGTSAVSPITMLQNEFPLPPLKNRDSLFNWCKVAKRWVRRGIEFGADHATLGAYLLAKVEYGSQSYNLLLERFTSGSITDWDGFFDTIQSQIGPNNTAQLQLQREIVTMKPPTRGKAVERYETKYIPFLNRSPDHQQGVAALMCATNLNMREQFTRQWVGDPLPDLSTLLLKLCNKYDTESSNDTASNKPRGKRAIFCSKCKTKHPWGKHVESTPKRTSVEASVQPEFSTKWAQPSSDNPKVSFDSFHQVKPPTYGYIEFDSEFPAHLSKFIADALRSLTRHTNVTDAFVNHMRRSFISLTYFKAARQLYTSMTDAEKSQVQPLKNVFYQKTKIPVTIASALSIIGHFDSSYGKVYVRDAPYLFRYWIWKGLNLTDDRVPVWREKYCLQRLHYLTQKSIDMITDEPYNIQVGETTQPVRLITYDRNTDLAVYTDAYANHPRAKFLMDLISVNKLDFEEFQNLNELPQTVVQELNLVLDFSPRALQTMRLQHDDLTSQWENTFATMFEDFVQCGPAPGTNVGKPAQIMTSDGIDGRTTSISKSVKWFELH